MILVSLHSASGADIEQITLFWIISSKYKNMLVVKSTPKLYIATHSWFCKGLKIRIHLYIYIYLYLYMYVCTFFRHLDSCKGCTAGVLLFLCHALIKKKSKELLSGLSENMLRCPAHQQTRLCTQWYLILKSGASTFMELKWCFGIYHSSIFLMTDLAYMNKLQNSLPLCLNEVW